MKDGKKSTTVGFEPTRAKPVNLAGWRLHHSATLSFAYTAGDWSSGVESNHGDVYPMDEVQGLNLQRSSTQNVLSVRIELTTFTN